MNRFRPILFLVAALAAAPLFATTNIYSAYETTRQALIKASIPEIQSSAKQVTAAAKSEKQVAIAAKADALAAARDLAAARTAFAALSDEVIKYRAAGSGSRPVVAYCPMVKKSWLQPKGAISNPYLAAAMRTCGEVKAE